ncbi:MAG: hypothetical protein E7032_08360 [Akkermansiaceae bacterium]|nr:hypothetical protein [Akkermansiaceae bacterium]MBP3499974.1 hypothetical protein [Akkermansia sp.]
MKHRLTSIMIGAGLALSLSSCEILLEDFNNYGFFEPGQPTTVQTGTNAAQTSFTKGIMWQPAHYDTSGLPIFGYADGRPVYGYTKQGSLIYQSNLLYSGCYVPSWGTSAAQPYGVIRTSASPL